jgi:hypothetical protein
MMPLLPPRLTLALGALAQRGGTETYGNLARALDVPGPGSIAKLTDALERLMEADAVIGAPLRAAMVVSRSRDNLPTPGFFAKARELGLYSGPDDRPLARNFHHAQLSAPRAIGA